VSGARAICAALAGLSFFAAGEAWCQETKITKGAAVVLVGSDGDRARDCRELAREVYKRPALLPVIDEPVARSLCAPASEATGAAAKVGELRASLGDRIDNAATQAVLVALAGELGTRAIILVSTGKVGTLVRVVRAADKPKAEPVSFDLMQTDPQKPIAWAELAESTELMLADPKLKEPAPTGELPGPRKSLAASIGKDPPPETPAQFFDSPWFWVAAGGVVAVGLAILIVSQATDVNEGNVLIQGKVLP
jgi:hypothetical protein